MSLHEIKHPLIQHKLALLRENEISTKQFRELSSEISMLLTYEATRDLPTKTVKIQGWAGELTVEIIRGKKFTVIPILRAGIGMLDGVLTAVPSAKVSVVGLYRDEKTLEPVTYFSKLVTDIADRRAIIIDPMLATGGTLLATVELLKQAGCTKITGLFLVAAPEGIKKITGAHPDVEIFTASVDEKLDENGYILPGLGDAGDKIFGTK